MLDKYLAWRLKFSEFKTIATAAMHTRPMLLNCRQTTLNHIVLNSWRVIVSLLTGPVAIARASQVQLGNTMHRAKKLYKILDLSFCQSEYRLVTLSIQLSTVINHRSTVSINSYSGSLCTRLPGVTVNLSVIIEIALWKPTVATHI